jgi:low affinity Fe/Cu permease
VVTLIQEYCNRKQIEATFDYIIIKSKEDLKKYKFIGSPSIRINKLDIDPNVRNINDYGFS